jgi:tRNA A-37 threonylcarbamoyl transferase component Bud32
MEVLSGKKMGENENPPQTIGRYEVIRVLGAGAMGSVVLAEDPKIKRKVAIKTVKMDAIRNEADRHEFMARFQREAEVSGLLNHPGIVAIYDVGESDLGPFLAMEYVSGKPLDHYIKNQVPLTISQKLRLAAAVAEALDHAHAAGIVHRDVKPGNVMVSDDLKPKLMDFGIAKREDASLTQTGTFLGTPSYASPEQIKEGTVDNRSDIFSFGVLVFELLSGQSPFPGTSINTILYRIVNEAPVEVKPPVTGILPEAWQRVFDKVLAKKPQDRYSTCAAFVREVVDAVTVSEMDQTGRRELLGILKMGGDSPLPPITSRAHDETMLVPQPSSGAGKKVGIGLGAAVAIGLGVWVALGSGGGERVLLKTSPDGAVVVINGQRQALPTSNMFKLKEGDKFHFERKGYKPTDDIAYSKKDGVPLEGFPLPAKLSKVVVKSDPEGALVVLDAKELGVATAEGLTIESWNQGEDHSLTLSKGDLRYDRVFHPEELPEGVIKLEKRTSTAAQEPPLDPNAKGFLALKGGFGVSVKVDGKDMGQLSAGGKLPLAPGTYKVEMSNGKFYFRESRSVTVSPGQGSTLAVPGTAVLTVSTHPGSGKVFIDGTDTGIESDGSTVTVAHGVHTIMIRGLKGSKTVTETISGDKMVDYGL